MKTFSLSICFVLLYIASHAECQYDTDEGFNGNKNANNNDRDRQPANFQNSQGNSQFQSQNEKDNNAAEADNEQPSTTVAAATTQRINQTTINPVHVIGQVNQVLNNVENFNISGIVDSALGIRNNGPIRNLVNGIIGAVFCNPFFSGFSNCGTRGRGQWKKPIIVIQNPSLPAGGTLNINQ